MNKKKGSKLQFYTLCSYICNTLFINTQNDKEENYEIMLFNNKLCTILVCWL